MDRIGFSVKMFLLRCLPVCDFSVLFSTASLGKI